MRTDSTLPGILIQENDSNGLITLGQSSGAPSSTATTASKFAIGCLLTDTTTGLQYSNTGTVASPSWNSVSEVTSSEVSESLIKYAEVSLTNAEFKAIRATPITLVAAPGAGKMIEFLSAEIFFDYTGAYTESADNMAIKYTNGSGTAVSETIEATGFVDATADTAIKVAPATSAAIAKTAMENKALVLHNTGDGEYGGGNAANAIRVKVAYRVHATGF